MCLLSTLMRVGTHWFSMLPYTQSNNSEGSLNSGYQKVSYSFSQLTINERNILSTHCVNASSVNMYNFFFTNISEEGVHIEQLTLD